MSIATSRVITVSDIVQWYNKGELSLSPKYQRNSVWNEKAKAYLIDTIVRGLIIPPIFLRQDIDINTKTTHREVIDGQQRIRAILEFVIDEKFSIRKSQNKEYGGKKYSDLDEEIQKTILGYEILVETVTEGDDSIIYDMFARLNSNNMVLNKQEIRNAKYWGDFKVLVYRLSTEYREFFVKESLLSDKDCARMRDSELINSMLILLEEGVIEETQSAIDKIYQKYDASFVNGEILEEKVHNIMEIIQGIYKYFNGNAGCFANKSYFFTLYSVVANLIYGIDVPLDTCQYLVDMSQDEIISSLSIAFSNFVSDFQQYIDNRNNVNMDEQYESFIKLHDRRTTGRQERCKRIQYLNDKIVGYLNE